MGRGGTNSLWSSGITGKVVCRAVLAGQSNNAIWEEVVMQNSAWILVGVMHESIKAYASYLSNLVKVIGTSRTGN